MNCDLIVKCPINSLSLGQVSYNILLEMFEKNLDIALFPIGQAVDIGAYNSSPEFEKWLKKSIESRYSKISKGTPSLSLWHLKGSEESIGQNNFLYTFHELSESTEAERNVVDMYKHVFFSSSFSSQEVFKGENCSYVPIGFDKSIKESNRNLFDEDEIHFSLIGKFEKRKNTAQILRLWNRKYGNNRKYKLSCLINNPFMNTEHIETEIGKALDNKRPFNINFLPQLPKNQLVNSLYNATNINLSGLSGGEGWNLPAFNCTALGRWSIVNNYSSHKDWATEDNCVLVEPDGFTSCEDGIFFSKADNFNQGFFSTISDDKIIDSFEKAEKLAFTRNESGTKLQSKFTYEKTLSAIMSQINSKNT